MGFEIYLQVEFSPLPPPPPFTHTHTRTVTSTLTKVLESAQSDRQTDKSYGSIYLFFDGKQLNTVIK